MKRLLLLMILLCNIVVCRGQDILVEAESFQDKGGWVVDHQAFTKIMSSYLLAHGLGRPVHDASTPMKVKHVGTYHVYVNTYNWTAPWHEGKGPGAFELRINGKRIGGELGIDGDKWGWKYVGKATLSKTNTLTLHDLTGFDGRIDAIYFSKTKKAPDEDFKAFSKKRQSLLGYGKITTYSGFDLVVAGAGIAGCAMALTAAEEGLRVALVDNLPWLGGNNALGVKSCGLLCKNLYPNLGFVTCRIIGANVEDKDDIDSYFVRVNGSGYINTNAKIPAWSSISGKIEKSSLLSSMERLSGKETSHMTTEEKRQNNNEYKRRKISYIREQMLYDAGVKILKNINIYEVATDGKRISSITGRDLRTGKDYTISGTLFADCTGDGVVGFLAGAEYMIGREGRAFADEPTAPLVADDKKMGMSMHWYAYPREDSGKFPDWQDIPWALQCNAESCKETSQWDWTWETGLETDNAEDAELARDNYFRAVYGNWAYLKNHVEKYRDYRLDYLQYIGMKRESRRIVGGYILNENDIRNKVHYEDASFTTTWPMDLHYATEISDKYFGKWAWTTYCTNEQEIWVHSYDVPYRCLYARDIDNLFLGGRDMSVTHQALGTVRVQSTLGMAGEVVGLAAKICIRHSAMPKDVYEKYLDELKAKMKAGTSKG